jgi:hypothetical protein
MIASYVEVLGLVDSAGLPKVVAPLSQTGINRFSGFIQLDFRKDNFVSVNSAVSMPPDYYRASAQRSRWIKDDLITAPYTLGSVVYSAIVTTASSYSSTMLSSSSSQS